MKAFSWSFSKLKNYETCPKRHYEVDLAKNYSDAGGEALTWGNSVHDAFHKALGSNVALPVEMKDFQKWIDMARALPGKHMVEQKYAITKDFQPCAYFSPLAWYRGIGDFVAVVGPLAIVLDWKTGGVKHGADQLLLLAQCIFAHFPEVQRVGTKFVWLQDDCVTEEVYNREDVASGWVGLIDRVKELETAAKTLTYPPKPGRLCYKWCPVLSCPFHGKSYR